ncbi:MAG: helix-turn-helix transcriptional regulator [Clostridia bacterium]|nr:helix-turn-helix transcriptional regulator [Clostridia bacterium]
MLNRKKIMNAVSENLSAIRQQHGLTREELAQILRISPADLQKLEAAELPPHLSLQIVFDIEREFHIHPSDFFTGEDAQPDFIQE